MSAISIVSNEYISVEYHPEQEMIYHTIHKPIGGPQAKLLMDALNAGTDALKKYGVTKWLSDDRKNGPLPPELIEWGFSDWNARTIAAGWKFWANVVPQEVAAAGALVPVIEDLHRHGLRMRVFTSVEEALAWLVAA